MRRSPLRRVTTQIAVAAAISLAILLQSLIASAHHRFPPREEVGASGFANVAEAPCVGDKGQADDLPAPPHQERPDCCLYCAERNHDETQPNVTVTLVDAIEFLSGAVAPAAYRIFDDSPRPPAGWTSSWSSRAPPSFS